MGKSVRTPIFLFKNIFTSYPVPWKSLETLEFIRMSPTHAQTIVSKFHRLVKGTMVPWKGWFSDCDRKSTKSAWDILLYQKVRSKKSNGIVVFLGYSVSWSVCWLYGNVRFMKIHCDSLMPGPLSWTSTQETTWKASPWPRRFYLSIWKKKQLVKT